MEEGTDGDKTSEEDMNWEDFMNVVTTYSCKFCTFTCTEPAEMGKHVKRTHMSKKVLPATSVTEETPSLTVVDPGLVMSSSSNTDTATASEGTLSASASLSLPSDSSLPRSEEPSLEAATGVPVAVVCEGRLAAVADHPEKETESKVSAVESDVTPVTVAISRESGESHFIIVEESPAEPNNLTGVVNQVTSSKPDFVETATVTNAVVAATTNSENQMTVTLPQGTVTSLDFAGPIYSPNLGQYSVIADFPIAEASTVSAPVTKELFLCGQCSDGFASIDECREHMLAAHSSLLVSGSGTEMDGSNQVSVGTQVVQKKKPGRKKRPILASPAPPKPKNPDEDDDDWEPGYDISGGRETRKKRKIRPPRALKEDYYLGKRKKKKKEKRSYYIDAYTVKCKLFNCHAKFRNQDSLDLHIKCHNDEDFDFTCIECKEPFDLWKNLRIHLWKKHEIHCDLFECDVCGIKTDTYHKLTVHKEIHSENRPYTCDICGKGFKQFSQMRNHQVIHSEYRVKEPERWYSNKQCEICKRVFANRKCLSKHIQAVHSKEKPFVCPYCGHAASRKAMLELHVRTHTGEKPFKCDVCPYATGDHNSLRRHKMRHTGQKQYKCQYCPYSCIQAISLKTHMKNKHPGLEGIYACDTCIFRTVNKQSYQQHMLDHQNGLVPDAQPKSAASDPQAAHSCSPDATAVEMQVQTMPTGEAQISADDLAKLSSCESLVPGNVSAATLIYQALSVISQTPEHNEGNAIQSAHILAGVQTLIKSSATEEGCTTHTIIFHLPKEKETQEGQTTQEAVGSVEGIGSEQVYFEQPAEVIEALQRASSQQAELINDSQGNLPTVITMEATEAELEGMSLNLVPGGSAEGTIIIQPATIES